MVTRELWLKALGVMVAGFALMQLVPYGRAHENPPVTREPQWDSPATRDFAARACFDCHSNETRYPWYTFVAPSSWLAQHDVDDGRRHLNFSEWDRPQRHADDLVEVVETREMPMILYLPFHAEARFDDAERARFAAGLRATLAADPPGAEAP
jgi:mono/diheme cytochrome c family protein